MFQIQATWYSQLSWASSGKMASDLTALLILGLRSWIYKSRSSQSMMQEIPRSVPIWLCLCFVLHGHLYTMNSFLRGNQLYSLEKLKLSNCCSAKYAGNLLEGIATELKLGDNLLKLGDNLVVFSNAFAIKWRIWSIFLCIDSIAEVHNMSNISLGNSIKFIRWVSILIQYPFQ